MFQSKVFTIEGGEVISDGTWDSGLLFVCETSAVHSLTRLADETIV